jgi:hypothetical protein
MLGLVRRSATALLACLVGATAADPVRADTRPVWLTIRAGTVARIDIAPWDDADEPEAALTVSAASLARNFSDDATRPDDIVYRPVGVRVRVVRLNPGGAVALVHGFDDRFEGYSPVARLIPEIPAGTTLLAAGGFGGFADFYPTLDTPEKHAGRVATGTRLVALGIGVAPYDPDSADLVRVRVRVLDGDLRARIGWVAVAYTGLPETHVPASADVAEKACRCRLVQFEGSWPAVSRSTKNRR